MANIDILNLIIYAVLACHDMTICGRCSLKYYYVKSHQKQVILSFVGLHKCLVFVGLLSAKQKREIHIVRSAKRPIINRS